MTNTKSPVALPTLQEYLKAGVQFGHEAKRWNPKMKKYVFGVKKGIHVIDLNQTSQKLEEAVKFLTDSARRGPVLFVGTKRQASDIVQEEAIRSGSYFVTHRWAGGLLTNFSMINESLNKLKKLEQDFETGVEGRTKYEISKMKVEWAKLDRLYGGIKDMKRLPTAIVVIDPRYEIGSVVEANKLNIPVVAVVDTNCDPDRIKYVVPGNDDALGAIKLFMRTFADAVKFGNGGQGVVHHLKDYSKVDVKVIKTINPNDVSISVDEETVSQPKAKIRLKTQQPEAVLEKKAEKSSPKPESKPKKAKAKPKKVEVELSTRTEKALKDAGVTLAKAKKMSDEELVKIKGLGVKAVEEIKNA